MTYTRFSPPAGLTGFHRLIWPLIYIQLVALKAWVRTHYGRGVHYYVGISRWGRVRLMHMPMDFAQSYAAPGSLKSAAFDFTLALSSPRLALACAEAAAASGPAIMHAVGSSSVHVPHPAGVTDTS